MIAPGRLALLEVLFHAFGLAKQEGDVLVRGLDEAGDDLERRLEFLDELIMFPVAPRLAQAGELAVNDGHLGEQVIVELPELRREPPELVRVDNRLSHESPFRDETKSG